MEASAHAQRAHAIANGVYVASPNRVGHEDEAAPMESSSSVTSFIADHSVES